MDESDTPDPLLAPPDEAAAHRLYDDPLLTTTERKRLKQDAFVELVASGCNYTEACEALGLDRSTAFRWRQFDAGFAQRCRDAFKVSVQRLEAEAERRAIKGSDKLLMFLLERRAPDKYHLAQKLEHSGAVDLAAAVLAARRRASSDDEPGSDLC